MERDVKRLSLPDGDEWGGFSGRDHEFEGVSKQERSHGIFETSDEGQTRGGSRKRNSEIEGLGFHCIITSFIKLLIKSLITRSFKDKHPKQNKCWDQQKCKWWRGETVRKDQND